MTSEEFADVTIIIAGYPSEIDEMLASNAGLKSRFQHFFEFPDWEALDCVNFFNLCANKDAFDIAQVDLNALENNFVELRQLEGWANGRDVKQVWDGCIDQRAVRVFDTGGGKKNILPGDLGPVIDDMLQARRPIHRAKNDKQKGDSPEFGFGQLPKMSFKQAPVRQEHTTRTEEIKADSSPKESPPFQQTGTGQETSALKVAESTEFDQASLVAEDFASSNRVADKQHAELQEETEGNLESKAVDDPNLDKREEGDPSDNDSCLHDDDDDDDDASQQSERDDGVPDQVWAELQAAKAATREREIMLEEQRIAYEEYLQDFQRKEEEAKRRHEEELERIRLEKEKEEQERLLREAREAEERRWLAMEEERKRREEAERKRVEEQRQKEQTMKRLQQINPCPMGFCWHRQGGGWRCAGGSHFVSNEELQRRFTSDV